MENRSKRLRLGVAVIALLLWVPAPRAVRAETSEVAALRQEVAELKQVVERLDARVEQIEKRLPSSSESSSGGAAVPEASAPHGALQRRRHRGTACKSTGAASAAA